MKPGNSRCMKTQGVSADCLQAFLGEERSYAEAAGGGGSVTATVGEKGKRYKTAIQR